MSVYLLTTATEPPAELQGIVTGETNAASTRHVEQSRGEPVMVRSFVKKIAGKPVGKISQEQQIEREKPAAFVSNAEMEYSGAAPRMTSVWAGR